MQKLIPATNNRGADSIRGQLWPRQRLLHAGAAYYVLLAVLVGGFIFYLYSYREQAWTYFPSLLQGTLVTLIISVFAMVIALVLGLFGALGRLTRFSLIRWFAFGYVELVRGTPLLVQILLWFYGIRPLLEQIGFDPHRFLFDVMTVLQNNSLVPYNFNNYFYGVVALGFNHGAYLTEVFRAGILSVERGQTEAALSLGLNTRQTMQRIVLPQAFRVTLPPLTNNFIALIQDSAFFSAIAVIELEYITIGLALPQPQAGAKMFVFIYGALFYLLLCYPLSLLARWLERRVAKAY